MRTLAENSGGAALNVLADGLHLIRVDPVPAKVQLRPIDFARAEVAEAARALNLGGSRSGA